MKAAPSDHLALLDLARLDVAVKRAEDARSNPPQAARVKELIAQRGEQGRTLVEKSNARDDLRAEMVRVESDIEIARSRQTRDRERLDKTAIARDARALEAEIESLAARIDSLETRELELMERLDEAESDVAEQQRLLDETTAEGQRLSAEGKGAVETAAADLARATAERQTLIGGLDDALLADYERISKRTTGAGLFQRGTCGGCHMALAPTDVAELAKAAQDDVMHCPECGCILVRTSESGL